MLFMLCIFIGKNVILAPRNKFLNNRQGIVIIYRINY